jgi:hypothetical protein
VADFAGAMINTSFQSVDKSTGTVRFYAPAFAGVEGKRTGGVTGPITFGEIGYQLPNWKSSL